MSIGYLLTFLGAYSRRSTASVRGRRRKRDIVHVTTAEPLSKRAKRRARGKGKGRK